MVTGHCNSWTKIHIVVQQERAIRFVSAGDKFKTIVSGPDATLTSL